MALTLWSLAVPAATIVGLMGCQKDEGVIVVDSDAGSGGGASGGGGDPSGGLGSGGAASGGIEGGDGGGAGDLLDALPTEVAPETSEMPPVVEPSVDAGADAPTTMPQSRPWNDVAQVIPGMLQAAFYDQGGEGVAYHDSDPNNTGADQARAANAMVPEATFRTTEGVDLGSTRAMTDKYVDSSPLQAGQLYVGWTVAGEWINYTVNVTATGHYTISALMATLSDGARVTFTLEDGTTTGPRALPWTHSLNAWRFVDNIAALDLTAGTHVLTMKFETPDINIEYLTFVAN
ncbi:MAG TPA: carbohydrate-binding protein [Polyangia bacterium]|nr:carbohydrate-binding protein [Polyangia bacterium]